MNDEEHPITLADWLVPGWANFSRSRWGRSILDVASFLCWWHLGYSWVGILLHFFSAVIAVQPNKK